MKVIELFAGSRSIGKAAEHLGLDVWSTDLHPFDGIDLAEDILKLSADDIPFLQAGTQGRKGNYERSKIPHDLCKEVLISAMLTSVGWHR